MILGPLFRDVNESIAQSVQGINFLFTQVVLGHSHIRLDDSAIGSILPSSQAHMRAFRIGTIIDNLCRSLLSDSMVHHILHHLEEQTCLFRIPVVIGTTFTIDICYLLIVTTFAEANLSYAVKQVIKVVRSKDILPLQSFIIQYKALREIFFQHTRSPDSKLCRLVTVHPIANRNHHVKVVHHHLSRPFVRRYSNFSNRVGQMDLSALVYLVKMVVDCWNSHPKQFRHPLL